jgi:hypothetical protein
VCRISDNSLIQITDLDLDATLQVSQRPYIADVAVAANPDSRTLWQALTGFALQPFLKLTGIATDVPMRRFGHLCLAALFQNTRPVSWGDRTPLFGHQLVL